MPDIYLDIYALVNFTLNYVLLYGTAVIMCRRTTVYKLIQGSVIGTVYAVGYALGWTRFLYGFGGITAVALAMVITAFRPVKWPGDAVLLLPFLTLAASAGGVGLAMARNEAGGSGSVRSLMQLGAVSVFVVVVSVALRRYRGTQRTFEQLMAEIVVWVADDSVACRALVDTGNQAAEPVTGDPVIVMEYEAVQRVLPHAWKVAAGGLRGDGYSTAGQMSARWGGRFSVVPFRALNGAGGLLPGFRPDRVVVRGQGREVVTSQVVLGITDQPLSSGGEYRALIPGSLSREGRRS